MAAKRKVAVVAGVGPGNGAVLTRRFSEAGYAVGPELESDREE